MNEATLKEIDILNKYRALIKLAIFEKNLYH